MFGLPSSMEKEKRDVKRDMKWGAPKHRTVRRIFFLAGGALALTGVGAGLAGIALWRRFGPAWPWTPSRRDRADWGPRSSHFAPGIARHREEDVRGQVVLITGSSRGLGLAMAEEFAHLGSKLVLCARKADELETARRLVARSGAEVLASTCDVTVADQVQRLVNHAIERFGRIDILINNAGVISVGPLQSQTITDFQEAMDVMFWGMLYPTLAVLPHMLARHGGRIANITSIGGKVSVPHLLPYGCAKFAAVGFSEGMRAELAGSGVHVTTVVPGLMRTGSHLNAYFKGDHRREFSWFSLGATLPLVSLDARRAAHKIVSAVRAGRAEIILSPQARLLATLHGIAPGITTDLMGLVNRLLPTGAAADRHTGDESETLLSRSFLTRLGRKAARDLNQGAGSGSAAGPSAIAG